MSGHDRAGTPPLSVPPLTGMPSVVRDSFDADAGRTYSAPETGPGQAAISEAELEAAAAAIMTAQNANDDEPERWEARHLARIALEAARAAAQEPKPAPGPCPGCESLRRQHAETCGEVGILAGALREIASRTEGSGQGLAIAAHGIARKALDGLWDSPGPAPELAAAMRETRETRERMTALAARWEAAAETDEAAARRPNRPRMILETRAGTRRQCATELRKRLEGK